MAKLRRDVAFQTVPSAIPGYESGQNRACPVRFRCDDSRNAIELTRMTLVRPGGARAGESDRDRNEADATRKEAGYTDVYIDLVPHFKFDHDPATKIREIAHCFHDAVPDDYRRCCRCACIAWIADRRAAVSAPFRHDGDSRHRRWRLARARPRSRQRFEFPWRGA